MSLESSVRVLANERPSRASMFSPYVAVFFCLAQVGERMADSTASGPLWQQRPYPAPGKILRGRGPSDGEATGPRQRGS